MTRFVAHGLGILLAFRRAIMDLPEVWLEDAVEEPSEPLALPVVRHHVAHDLHDDELGIRSLLEHPEALPTLRRAHVSARKRHATKSARKAQGRDRESRV
jgi:hypothetical protein